MRTYSSTVQTISCFPNSSRYLVENQGKIQESLLWHLGKGRDAHRTEKLDISARTAYDHFT
jgi:hypothetical protein